MPPASTLNGLLPRGIAVAATLAALSPRVHAQRGGSAGAAGSAGFGSSDGSYSNETLSTGAIVGIAVGCGGALVLMVFCAYCLCGRVNRSTSGIEMQRR